MSTPGTVRKKIRQSGYRSQGKSISARRAKGRKKLSCSS